MPGRTYNKVPDCESIVVLNTNETFVNEDYKNGDDGEWQDDQLTFTSVNDELVVEVDTEVGSGAVGSRTYSTVIGEDYTIAFDYDISSLDTDSDNTYEFGVLLIQSKYVNGNFVTVGTPEVLSTANSGVGSHSITLTNVDAELMGITLKVFSYNSTTTIGESFIIDDFTITGTTVTETFDCSGNNYLASNYRFGFNGKEMDNEVSGNGNQYNYGFRIYNPRLGKFLSVDPLTGSYPWFTPYQFASNTPIQAIDIDGLEGTFYLRGEDDEGDIFISLPSDNLTRQVPLDAQYGTVKNIDNSEGEKQLKSLAADFTPIVGDLKGFVEAFTGKDLITKEKLAWWQRGLGLIFLTEVRGAKKLASGGSAGKIGSVAPDAGTDVIAGYSRQSNVMNAAGEGLEVLPTPISNNVTATSLSAAGGLGKLATIKADLVGQMEALNLKHLRGAIGDLKGNPIIINDYVYDHIDDVKNHLNGVNRSLKSINKLIDSGELSGDVLNEAVKLRSSIQKQYDQIRGAILREASKVNETLPKGNKYGKTKKPG